MHLITTLSLKIKLKTKKNTEISHSPASQSIVSRLTWQIGPAVCVSERQNNNNNNNNTATTARNARLTRNSQFSQNENNGRQVCNRDNLKRSGTGINDIGFLRLLVAWVLGWEYTSNSNSDSRLPWRLLHRDENGDAKNK